MEVQEFVSSILKQLEASLDEATKQSKTKEFHFDKSVKFDLAVTHATSKEGDVGGKFKAGIKIVDFEVGGKGKLSAGHEVVQRIQFGVNVWDKQHDSGAVESGNVSSLFNPNQRF